MVGRHVQFDTDSLFAYTDQQAVVMYIVLSST